VSERLEEGIPWREVLRVAEAEDADVIVLGAHSRGVLEQAFFGSTVNHIVREARRPVLVVRGTSTRLEARQEAPVAGAATSLPAEIRG
jgi:universal stress protein E